MGRCKICLSNQVWVLNQQEGHLYRYATCANCTAMWAISAPYESIRQQYSSLTYWSERKKDVEGFNGWRNWRGRRFLVNHLLEKVGFADIEQSLGERGRVLDVGCAEGDLMEVFRFRDWDVSGIEINEHMVEYGRQRGFKIHCSSMEDVCVGNNHYDCIFCSHVIEHLTDPAVLFLKSREWLKSRGYLIIDTPVYNFFGDPHHIFFFNQASLCLLAGRFNFFLRAMTTYEDINPEHRHWSENGVVNGFFLFEKSV